MTQVFWLGKKQSIHTQYIQSKKKKESKDMEKDTYMPIN